MKRILIVSPDPEEGRILELAFELKGWEVEHAVGFKSSHGEPAEAVLVDMIEGSEVCKKRLTRAAFKGSKVAAIAPRGEDAGVLEKKMPRIDLMIRRPYNLTHLVRLVDGLVGP